MNMRNIPHHQLIYLRQYVVVPLSQAVSLQVRNARIITVLDIRWQAANKGPKNLIKNGLI